MKIVVTALLALAVATGTGVAARQAKPTPAGAKPATPAPVAAAPKADPLSQPADVVPPPDYVIGPQDVLAIVMWREKDLTSEVMVRPDGMVTLPLVNDIRAGGLTPEQFRQKLTEAMSRYVESPNATVIVKTINSRKIYIMGEVAKPGPYTLGGPTTVLQLIAEAGGLLEYADAKNINIMRTVDGKVTLLRFNYRDVSRGRKVEQNVLLRPGDTVIVP